MSQHFITACTDPEHLSSGVTVCPPSVHESQGGSLAAPAVAGQGVGTRNQAAWMSIADFLTLENLRAVLAARAAADSKRSASAAAGAGLLTLPHGNHGETFK